MLFWVSQKKKKKNTHYFGILKFLVNSNTNFNKKFSADLMFKSNKKLLGPLEDY